MKKLVFFLRGYLKSNTEEQKLVNHDKWKPEGPIKETNQTGTCLGCRSCGFRLNTFQSVVTHQRSCRGTEYNRRDDELGESFAGILASCLRQRKTLDGKGCTDSGNL